MSFLDREPVLTAGLLQGIVILVFAFLKLAPEQTAAIEGAVIACVMWVTRGQVTPVFSPSLPHLGITPESAVETVQKVIQQVNANAAAPVVNTVVNGVVNEVGELTGPPTNPPPSEGTT